jgi:hypothetical protein
MKCHCRLCELDWESKKEAGPKACPGCKSYSWRPIISASEQKAKLVGGGEAR